MLHIGRIVVDFPVHRSNLRQFDDAEIMFTPGIIIRGEVAELPYSGENYQLNGNRQRLDSDGHQSYSGNCILSFGGRKTDSLPKSVILLGDLRASVFICHEAPSFPWH